MLPEEITKIINELIEVFKGTVSGEYAIALAGAHAKGKFDANSDIDIFIYTKGVQPISVRRELIGKIADDRDSIYIDEEIDKAPWGGCMDFYYKGFKIETSVRSIDAVNIVVNDCINGNIKVEPIFWTIHGYYNYIYLSEIDFIVPLDDPYNLIHNLKGRIKAYPAKLKKAIINSFWWKGTFWADNYHYISAIKREDIIYTSGIIQQSVHNIIQVLFALNEKYFGGDKRIEEQLKGLLFCPTTLMENMEFLLSSPRDKELLEKQRFILKDIIADVEKRINDR